LRVSAIGGAAKIEVVERQQQRCPDRAQPDETNSPAVMLDQPGRERRKDGDATRWPAQGDADGKAARGVEPAGDRGRQTIG